MRYIYIAREAEARRKQYLIYSKGEQYLIHLFPLNGLIALLNLWRGKKRRTYYNELKTLEHKSKVAKEFSIYEAKETTFYTSWLIYASQINYYIHTIHITSLYFILFYF